MPITAISPKGRYPQRVTKEGRIATLTKALKHHWCSVCQEEILPGSQYYSVVAGGSGLGGIKFPTRVHPECLEKHFDHIRRSREI